jgi:hypothetical protein
MTYVYSAQSIMSIVLPGSLEKYVGPQQMWWVTQFNHELSEELVSTDRYDAQDGLEIRYQMQVEEGDSSMHVSFRYADTSVGTTTATTTSLKFEGPRISY